MKETTIVALDFDGVLADTCPLVCELLGQPKTRSEITSYGMVFDMFGADLFREGVKMAHEETTRLATINDDTAYQVRRIMDLPNVLTYVLTANDSDSIPRIKRWLKMHGIEMPVWCVGVGNSSQKANYDWDVLIDDHPNLATYCAGRDAIMFPAPYNSAPNTTTWDTIYDHIVEVSAQEE